MSIDKHFPLPLDGRLIDKGRWMLLAPFKYVNPPVEIEVPVGFVTDGASIPRIAWTLIGSPWSGRYARAAVPHDYGYEVQILTRREYDDAFLVGMTILDVPLINKRIMYRCVRLFSWIPWNMRKVKIKLAKLKVARYTG